MFKSLGLFVCLLILPVSAQSFSFMSGSADGESDWQILNTVKFEYFFLDIYNISLYSQDNTFSYDQKFALSLEYLRANSYAPEAIPKA